jgi:hypothetical protein
MKRFAISFFLLVAVIGFSTTVAAASLKPSDYRRTLFVPVAQRMLVLEAPLQMCFLDKTSYLQALLYENFSAEIEKKGGQVLLAVFMDCNDMANGRGWSDPDGLLPNVGLVTWMNPSIGDLTSMSRQDYLDMREASFLQYAQGSAGDLLLDKTVRRTENGVSVGMSGEIKGHVPKVKTTGIIATTVLRQVPIEVTLRYTGSAPPALDRLYPLMDKFMEQQVALNR